MIDIASFNKALRSVWIRKYLDESNKGKWKLFLTLSSKNLEAKLSLRATLTKKTRRSLLTILEILEIWSELNYEGSIETVESFLFD